MPQELCDICGRVPSLRIGTAVAVRSNGRFLYATDPCMGAIHDIADKVSLVGMVKKAEADQQKAVDQQKRGNRRA